MVRWAFILLVILASGVSAREVVPDNDGPEQQEEVMPQMPAAPPGAAAPSTATANIPWKPTDFGPQPQALGWTNDIFKTPPPMAVRVQFWIDIYTKYTSSQGLLHDSKYINIIYEQIDFKDISGNGVLTDTQKERARRKLVKDKKSEVVALLKRLDAVKDPAGLQAEDRRIFDLFAKVDEPKKFKEAQRRGRLRFQLGQRDQFVAGICQSGRYLKQMEEIFRQEGLPMELTRLPFVESSFNLRARSKVGASGLWQFMRTTARSYLRMDNSADERNDPLRATLAAAKKLKTNFQMLKNWPLAITAYNRGSSGVKRLTEKLGTTEITEIIDVRKGRFGFAGANFYANFLAALEVDRNADKYFGILEVMPELRGAEVQLMKSQFAKDFLQWFDGDLIVAQALNPHIAKAVWENRMPLSRKSILRVPLLRGAGAKEALQ